MNPAVLACLALIATCGWALAQNSQKPIPRMPHGTVNLGSPPGELGLWLPPNAGDERLVDLDLAPDLMSGSESSSNVRSMIVP